MRLDKYLKVSRLIKRLEIKVASLIDSTKKIDAPLMYELISQKDKEV